MFILDSAALHPGYGLFGTSLHSIIKFLRKEKK